jgi:isopenicillin-N N-acyltransferase like protein
MKPSQPLLAALLLGAAQSLGADVTKARALTANASAPAQASDIAVGNGSADPGGAGYRFTITNGVARVPVVVVGGTPYQMGWRFGRLSSEEIRAFVPAVVAGFRQQLGVSEDELDRAWALTSGHTDSRVLQEIVGVADGAGIPVRTLQHAHTLPLLMPYSCSSIAAWGEATKDGHLYQTRNLDWSLEAGAHEFPVLLVHIPSEGHAHVMPTFAGVVGANTGMNDAGVVLSEIGDAGAKERPYNLHAPHFTTWFRSMLYDAGDLDRVQAIFRGLPQTKSYHFVFGDGRTRKRAVKVRTLANAPAAERVRTWTDNDAGDELAPNVLSCVVYHDEGRGAFPTLSGSRGKLDGPSLVELANSIPIKGGNVLNAVYDGTGLRLWASFAGGDKEAYQRPYVFLDLNTLDGDHDGKGDLAEGASDGNHNGVPDFLDPR